MKGALFVCSGCGAEAQPVKDISNYDQVWRHLNFAEYPIYFHAEHPRTTCSKCNRILRVNVLREHSYRYDSYDPKYETIKYVRPKKCDSCPLAHDSKCQKVYKMKITTDLRKHTAPACGSQRWREIAEERSAIERVNAYLKEFFQLNNVRNRTDHKAKVHFVIATLVCNCTKLVCDRLNRRLNSKQLI